MAQEHIVVVGAGQAGAAVVARLRALGFDGALTLLGAEPAPPYQRPPLSKKYLTGEMTRERLFLRPAAFYADQDITLRTGAAVRTIDRAARTLTVCTDGAGGGETLHWDRLILATGAAPRRLPADRGGALAGVHVMRDLADVDAMAGAFVAGRRLLVVGGGYIGLEAAAVAATRGLDVTLLEAAPRILVRVACAQTSDWFRTLHTAHGVRILEGTAVARLTGTDHVTGADVAGAHIPCDLAVVGIGVTPRTALAEAAGLEVADGIVVDTLGRTSDPDIWAAGDCALFPHGDGRLRLESVQNAIDQAEAVAANILGAAVPYVPQPWFWSDQYDAKLQIAGLGQGADSIVVRDAGDGRSHWYFAQGRLISVDAMNDARAYMVGKRLIEAGRSPDPAALAEPATDLRALLRD
ncbi:NAD(P)/FAD-dependent oxidoreductase [Rhodobaculum claviforme]|uniref:Pyridine nucleotide-disulfide oxidoreductase n=1 Tax=Rhodobaculum claviforme TaxID=1549854 RepID=A0A934WEP8_9RHOB|nr:FAD-dependent oxidoreductase [Rhodobaculum claviforme]MBK5926310.1 pyridine nucleotide-disulfide oxidoreductase [Rhodobaculum claviforme]